MDSNSTQSFDCGIECSNWKSINNAHDIVIYFSEPGTPLQQGLSEIFNGLLHKNGLPKKMIFNKVEEAFIQSIASKRNNIPKKSWNY